MRTAGGISGGGDKGRGDGNFSICDGCKRLYLTLDVAFWCSGTSSKSIHRCI